jgi:hypothetical protein
MGTALAWRGGRRLSSDEDGSCPTVMPAPSGALSPWLCMREACERAVAGLADQLGPAWAVGGRA